MGSPALGVLATVLVLLVTAVQAVYTGMPGMDQDPTTTYGSKPAVKYENKAANCIWYGWENPNFPPESTNSCSTALWLTLINANPANLEGFMYYASQEDNIYFDMAYYHFLCTIGCFDLSASAPTPADSTGNSIATSPATPSVASAPPPEMGGYIVMNR